MVFIYRVAIAVSIGLLLAEALVAQDTIGPAAQAPTRGADSQSDPENRRQQAWSALCQTILAANEFIYLP